MTLNFDGLVKSRHSRENGNPEYSNYLKRLDSGFRRNDRKAYFQTFYEIINFDMMLKKYVRKKTISVNGIATNIKKEI
jgi:hypothetical protein